MKYDKRAVVVVGLGYGDEGKGLATDYLCQLLPKPLVIRFNGGGQAGHTVVTSDRKRHVFSNFGSGTLRGVPTYWSNYCTFSPESTITEYQELQTLGVKPVLMLDNWCPVTTHYDILYNRAIEATRGNARHGSCGQGFGATIERHNILQTKLYACDLLISSLLKDKLQNIRSYYQAKIDQETKFSFKQFDHDAEDERFRQYATEISILSQQGAIRFVEESEMLSHHNDWNSFIFEGAQGILLDMDFGFFPHVTHSNTTTKNALKLLENQFKDSVKAEILYVTRSYQTRHGAGPFPNDRSVLLMGTEGETNKYHEYQGEFKTSCLDIDLLNYALSCDAKFSAGLKKHLIVTCVDHLKDKLIPCYKDNTFKLIGHEELSIFLETKFISQVFNFSSCSECML